MAKDYFVDRKIKTLKKLDNFLNELPPFCAEFFLGIESTTSPLTRMNYAMDLAIFFDFISEKYDIELKKAEISLLEKITAFDIEQFLGFITSFEYKGKLHVCNERAKARKLSAIRSMYKYFFNHNKIVANTAAKVATPKIREKEIIRLENGEISELLTVAESGEGLSSRQASYHENTRIRDVALLTLFLGTGIRISELVGLNVDDLFFDNNSFLVTRKGGGRTILYYTDEVKEALLEWLDYRETIKIPENEKALFLSLQNKRISVRAVENLVKKYAKIVTPLKKITPHKLRSTFGTKLYKQTGDIYVVADYLGHKDVNTTKRHYAAISDDMRKSAIKTITLKDE